MNDEIEIRLRDAFRDGSLPPAPASLRDRLDQVPEAPVGPAAWREAGARGRRRPWGALAVAAVLLLGGAVVASFTAGGPGPRLNPSPSTPPTDPAPGAPVRIVYDPRPTDVVLVDVLPATVAIVQHRIDATGVVGAQVSTDDQGRIVVDLPGTIDPGPIRSLIGQVGQLAFIRLGDVTVERGAHLDLSLFPAPVVDSTNVSDATVMADQNGQPGLQIALVGDGAQAFEHYTAANIGKPFAIVLDGTVIAAPTINEAIPGGNVQITFPSGEMDRTELARLATIIKFGPLPVPLAEISNGPAPVGPSPIASSLVLDPPIHCGPPVAVAGLQLDCERGVHAAVALLPAGHPAIREITFDHGCPEVPGSLIDCATQMFGIVGITFADGSPSVRILVDYDLKASYLP
jgi:hypothetical protein